MNAHETKRLYYAYARHALVTALRLLRVTPGSTVLIPEFICRDVLASLSSLGAKPVFYEIDDTLQPRSISALDRSPDLISRAPAAIIAVNYFGFPADLERVRKLVPSHEVPIVEDNAHGWLSADANGKPLGSRTKVGITSVRKTIRIPDGAYLEWRDDGTLDVQSLHEPLPLRKDVLPISYHLRRAISQVDARLPLAVMPLARDAVRLLRRWSGKPAVSENAEEEWNLPANRSPHRTSLKVMGRIDETKEVERRRELFHACDELASEFGIQRPFTSLPPHASPQGFPYFLDSKEATAFARAVRRHRLGEDIAWPALPSHTSLAVNSRLRSLHLVNFLV